jgi:hypothetical protein
MKKSLQKVTTLIAIVLVTVFFSQNAFAQNEITIQVSSNVLNLNQNGKVVTVHTDLPFSSVSATSVTLNGVTIDH